MDGVFVSIGLAIATTGIGGVIWGIRLEGRVNSQEAVNTAQGEEIIHRLDRIERKIDSANGSKNYATS